MELRVRGIDWSSYWSSGIGVCRSSSIGIGRSSSIGIGRSSSIG